MRARPWNCWPAAPRAARWPHCWRIASTIWMRACVTSALACARGLAGLPHRTCDQAVVHRPRCLAEEIQRTRAAGARLGSEWELGERFGEPPDRAAGHPAAAGQWAGGVPARPRQWPGHPRPAHHRQHPPGARLPHRRAARPDGRWAPSCSSSMPMCPALAVSRADLGTAPAAGGAALTRLEHGDTFERYDLLGLVHCVARLADSPIIDLFSRCLGGLRGRASAPSLAERLATGGARRLAISAWCGACWTRCRRATAARSAMGEAGIGGVHARDERAAALLIQAPAAHVQVPPQGVRAASRKCSAAHRKNAAPQSQRHPQTYAWKLRGRHQPAPHRPPAGARPPGQLWMKSPARKVHARRTGHWPCSRTWGPSPYPASPSPAIRSAVASARIRGAARFCTVARLGARCVAIAG